MANRYWVGGTGTWNTTSTTNWSTSSGGTGGASVPGISDTVFFDQAGTYTVTMTGALNCLDFRMSAGTVTFATGTSPSLTIYGTQATFATGTVWNGPAPIFSSLTQYCTLTTNGVVLPGVTLSSVNYGVILADALTTTATGTITHNNGNLNLNGFTVTCGIYSSSNSSSRSITFGTSNIVLAHTTAAQTVLNMATATNFTYTGTGGFTSAMSVTRTFTFGTTGGTSTNAPNLTLTGSGTSVGTFTTGSYFNKLDFGTTAFTVPSTTLNLNSLTTSTGGTFTGLTLNMVGTGSITSNAKPINILTINHSGTTTLNGALTTLTTGTAATTTLTSGTLALNNFTLTTAIFSSTNANTRSIQFGSGNIVVGTTSSATVTVSMANATNFTWTGTGAFTSAMTVTRTFTFGTTGGSSANAPNLSLTSGTIQPTFTSGSYFNTLDFTGSTFSTGVVTVNLNSLVLGGGTAYSSLSPTMVGTGIINTNGKLIGDVTINHNGTTTLSGALSCSTYTQTSGTIDFATFNLTCSTTATYNAGTLSNISTITCTTWTCAGTFTLTSGTITPSTSFVVTGAFNYNGGTLSAVPTFTHTSGTVTLGKAYGLAATGIYSLNGGTLNLNGFNLTTGIFSSSNSTIRSIAFGTGNIVLATTVAGQTVLAMATATNFTYTGTGGFTTDASVTRTVQFGGTAGGTSTNAPNLTLTGSGVSVLTFTTGSYFNKIDFGTTAFTLAATTQNLNSLTTSTGGTFTNLSINARGTGTITTNGKTIAALTVNHSETTTLNGALSCTTYTNTSGTIDFNFYNLTCSSTARYTAGTLLNIGTISCTTFYFDGTFTHNQGTINPTSVEVGTGVTFTLDTSGTLGAVDTFYQRKFTDTVVNFNKNYSLTGTGTYFLYGGTLNLNNNTLTVGVFNSNNATISNLTVARTINFGTGNIELAHTTAGTINLQMGDYGGVPSSTVGITFNGTGGFTSNMSITRSFVVEDISMSSASSYSLPNLTLYAGSSLPTFSTRLSTGGGGTYDNLNIEGTSFSYETGTGRYFNITGNLTLGSGTSYSDFRLVCYSGVYSNNPVTWDFKNKTINSLDIQASATSSCTFASSVTLTTSTTLTSGTLNLNNFTLTTGIFSSNNSNTRSISFGSGNIELAHNSPATTVLSMATATGFTLTGTGGFTSTMSVTRTFDFGSIAGGNPTNAPNLTLTSGTSTATLTTGSYFNKLDFGTTAFTVPSTSPNLNSLTLSSSGTYAALTPVMVSTGSINTNGNITQNQITIDHTGTTTLSSAVTLTPGNANTMGYLVLTRGTLDLNNFTLTLDSFSSNNSNTRSINFGTANIVLNQNGLTGSAIDMATATGFTWAGTGGFTAASTLAQTYKFGSTGGGSVTNAPNLTFGSGSAIATITTGSWFNNLNFGTTAFTVPSATINVANLVLSPNGSYTSMAINLNNYSSEGATITSNGKAIGPLNVTVINTLNLQDSLSIGSNNLTFSYGTINLNNFTLSCRNITANGSGTNRTITGPGTVSVTPASAGNIITNTFGWVIYFTNCTINCIVNSTAYFSSTITNLSTCTLNMGGTGTLSFVGNGYSFANITATAYPSTIKFYAGSTTTLSNFTLSGTSGNQVTIQSTTPGTRYTLSKASGDVVSNYLNIQDSNATGGAYWRANNSTDNGNNLGWNFVGNAAGRFMAFF